ncbi:hypothetical protein HWQ67_18080 [Candidatus Magnetobacterium casensis]|uniref:Uncharacterized protein n=1 Tax=Candidatus Magnetobacterium casense TaxID=1455061 RepID=A0ABS6S3Q4_9BACT|nr:hypothetical protein [Candidatus Magnetobacterium casensis]
MTVQQADKWLHDQVRRQAELWFVGQCRNPYARYYLYYKTGEILISDAEHTPEGYTLADPQRISQAWTVDQACTWAHSVLRRTPCLPLEENP